MDKKTTKKELAALLNISPARVQQLSERMVFGEDYWYVEIANGKLMQFSDAIVAELKATRQVLNKGGRPRKHPVSDAPKRPRGRPRKKGAQP